MRLTAFLFGATLMFGGCARMELDRSNLSTHVQLNTLRGDAYEVKKSFEEDRWNHHFLFRLVPTSRPNVAEMISAHVAKGEIVTDLEIKKETSFINGLICVLVGIIYCPETLTLKGNVAARKTPPADAPAANGPPAENQSTE